MNIFQLLIKGDSATWRGIRTAIQGFVAGLFLTVWRVPGVPEAVFNYLNNNSVKFALALGIPTGVVAFVWSFLRKDVKNV